MLHSGGVKRNKNVIFVIICAIVRDYFAVVVCVKSFTFVSVFFIKFTSHANGWYYGYSHVNRTFRYGINYLGYGRLPYTAPNGLILGCRTIAGHLPFQARSE